MQMKSQYSINERKLHVLRIGVKGARRRRRKRSRKRKRRKENMLYRWKDGKMILIAEELQKQRWRRQEGKVSRDQKTEK